jgi:hypothetical protein
VTAELATGRYSTFRPGMGVPVAITVGLPRFPLSYKLRHRGYRLALLLHDNLCTFLAAW